MKTLITTILLILAVSQADASWEKLDGPYGGVIKEIYYANGEVFINTYSGLYKSDANNIEWSEFNYNLGYPPDISKLIIKDNDKFLITYRSVYKFLEELNKWVTLYSPYEDDVNLKYNPRYFQDGIAFNNTLIVVGSSGNGISISTDSGITWEILSHSDGTVSSSVICIEKHKDNLYIGTPTGLYSSTNMGEDWTLIFSSDRVESIKVIDNVMYAQISTMSERYLYVSYDDGVTWGDFGLKGERVYDIVEFNNKYFIATISGVYVSSDNGTNWELINDGLYTRNSNNQKSTGNLEIVDGNLWAATGNGIFSLDVHNDTWNNIDLNGVSSIPVQEIINTDENTIFLGTSHNGVFISEDSGETWLLIEDGLPYTLGYAINLKSHNGNAYLLYSDFIEPFRGQRNLYQYSYEESKWQNITEDVENNFYDFFIFDDTIFLTVEAGLIASSDEGKTWLPLENELEKYFVYSLILHKDVIIAATADGIYSSMGLGQPFSKISSKVIHRMNSSENIIIGINSSSQEIFISIDNAYTWETIFNLFDVTHNPFYSLSFHSQASLEDVIFLSYGLSFANELIYSNDYGETWKNISVDLLKGHNVSSMSFTDKYLYVGVAGGVFRAKLSDFGIEVSVAENEIETYNYLYTYPPYPVPARSEVQTKIYFDSSTDIAVENIAVYDIYGRKLPTKESLRFEQDTFYSGNIIWDCSAVEPGVYIIRINHGTEVRAVKVMVGM